MFTKLAPVGERRDEDRRGVSVGEQLLQLALAVGAHGTVRSDRLDEVEPALVLRGESLAALEITWSSSRHLAHNGLPRITY